MPQSSGSQRLFWQHAAHLPFLVVAPDAPALTVIRQMKLNSTSCVLVVAQGTLVGMFTDRTLIELVADGIALADKCIADLVTPPLISVTEAEAADITQLAERFRCTQSRYLPVLDSEGHLLDVLTPDRVIAPLQQALTTQAAELQQATEQQQQLAQALQESQTQCQITAAKLNDILSSSIVSIASFRVFSQDCWQAEYYSPGSESVFGYTAEELMAENSLWWMRVIPEDWERVVLPALAQTLNGDNAAIEYRFRHKNNRLCWIAATLTARWDDAAEGWIATMISTDVTERKQIEEALRESETKLRKAQRVAHVGSWELDLFTQKIIWSEEMFRIFGLEPGQVEPTYPNFLQFLTAQDAERLYYLIRRTVLEGVPYEIEHSITRPDGSIRYLEGRGEAVCNAQGQVIKLFGAAIDITERKRLEELLRSQAQKEQALNRVIRAIRNSLDLETIFSTAAAEVTTLLQVDRSDIIQYLPQRNLWLNIADYRRDISQPSAWGTEIPDAGNAIAARLKNLEIIQLDATYLREDPINADLAQLFPGAWLLVPIDFDGCVWGSLAVIRNSAHSCWQPWEVELIQAVADQLAIAIQQSQLYQRVQHLNAGLETQVQERTRQLQTALEFEALLKRITDKVRDSLDETHILQTAVQELALCLGVRYCDAAIYDGDRKTAKICYEHISSPLGSDLVPAKGKRVQLETMQVVHDQILQGQYVQFCLYPTGLAAARQDEHAYSILACPLMDDQGVFGNLWLFKPRHDCFTELEIRLVQQVANQCAIALRQSCLYQAAQQQVQELERLNHLKDDFLSTVSHELRTPLSNIKMATQMLEIALQRHKLSGLGSTLREPIPYLHLASVPSSKLKPQDLDIPRYLQILKDECERETLLINDLLDLVRLDAGTEPLIVTAIDLQIWIPHLVESFSSLLRTHQQTLRVEIPADLPTMTTDLSYLERILVELLNNACKYTPAGETIVITAQAWEAQSVVDFSNQTSGPTPPDFSPHAVAAKLTFCLQIRNSGIEIPLEERDRIFDKFYRIPNNDPWKYGGTGLGLALVKKQVEQLQGTIAVTSQANWTTFTLHLPQIVGQA